MARPLKDGIDYFPLDVNFLKDIKIRKLLIACGPQSIAVLISLLCNIYQDEGYYIGWDEDVRFLISDEVGVKESLVQEVVTKTIDIDFFDANLFKKYKILTSIGIQKRYVEATSRRKSNRIKKSFNLINVDNNGVNVNNNEVNVDKSTQRKGKERKEKESKERENIYTTLIKLLKHKPDKSLFISLSQKYDLEKLISELEKSEWLCLNLDLSTASDDFITNSINGKYRRFNTTKKQNTFHNFEGSDRSDEDFEELARIKREKQLKELEEEESL